jgi:hypothetical protein
MSDSALPRVFVTITDLAIPKAVIRNSDKEDRTDLPRVLVKDRIDRTDLPRVLVNDRVDLPHVLVTR